MTFSVEDCWDGTDEGGPGDCRLGVGEGLGEVFGCWKSVAVQGI